jgi:protein-S-isoprenylcysteine O-methyltransferase Ste14
MEDGIRQKARSLVDGQGYFLILLVLSVLFHLVVPVRVVLHAPFTFFGIIIIGIGLVTAIRCRSLFLQNRTTLSPYESPAYLITTGPFRFSRNPVYLAMAAILLGSAVVMGTVVSFVFTGLFILMMDLLFIPDEEERLETIFGKEYRDYKKRVRRWI